MSPVDGCISDFVVDRLLAGDLTASEEQQSRGHLARCERCAARLAQVDAERAAFSQHGPRLAWPKIEVPERAVSGLRRHLPVLSLAAAALLFVIGRSSFLERRERDEAPSTSGTRTKGGASFELYIRHAGQTRRAGDREVVFPGDQLQLEYTTTEPGHLLLLSLDGKGTASVYFPSTDSRAWPAPAGRGQLVPESTILDAVLGEEYLHALYCARRVEVEPLRQELVEGLVFDAPPGCSVRTILLEKKVGP